MYRTRAVAQADPVAHRVVLFYLVGLMAWVALAACGPESVVNEPASSPTSVSQSEDIRERIVSALQKPGMTTRVEYDIQVVVHGLVTVERNVAWLDIEHDTVRLETGNPPTILLITADGEATYRPQDNSLTASHPRDPSTPSFPPKWSDKESINALGPLGVALNYGEWKSRTSVEEDGKVEDVWLVESLPQNDTLGESSMEVRIDASTDLPITASIIPRPTPPGAKPFELSIGARYRIEFFRQDALAKDLFDLDAVRDLPLTFGGQLDAAKASEFTVYWLGRTTSFGDSLPTLALSGFQLHPGDLQQTRATLDYRQSVTAPGQPAGSVSIVQWPKVQFESILFYGGANKWWLGPGVARIAAVIDGAPAEYVIVDTAINPPGPVYPSGVPVPPSIPPGALPTPLATPTPTDRVDTERPVPSPTKAECIAVDTAVAPVTPLQQPRVAVTPPIPTPTPVGTGITPACSEQPPAPPQSVPTVIIDSRPRHFVRAIVWLPSTVISIEATPMWRGDEGRDANAFNSLEGLEAVIRALMEIK